MFDTITLCRRSWNIAAILCISALLPGGIGRAAANPAIQQPLQVARAEGAVSFGSGARIPGRFVQEADQPIFMQAVSATELSLQDGHTPGYDANCCGGGYIHFVDSASWKFTVNTLGRYTAWEHALFPGKGDWNHAESMDGDGRNITDHSGPSTGWVWVKAGAYDLTKGEHLFQMSYLGGARLDAVVLSRDGQNAPNLAALSPSYRGPVKADIWTAEVKPFDLARWSSVQFDYGTAGVGTRIELSADGGKSWRPFNPKVTKLDLPVRGSGADSLQFHLTLEGAAGRPPFFGGGTIEYQPGPKNFRVVENSRIRMEVDPYGVRSLRDKQTGVSFCEAGAQHVSLASIVAKASGAASPKKYDLYGAVLEDFHATAEGDITTLRMTSRLTNGMGLTTEAKLLPNAQIEWRLTISNPTDQEVAQVFFPMLPGFQVGDTDEDNTCLVPTNLGWGDFVKPARPVEKMRELTMRWMMQWNPRAGYYIGIEDPEGNDFDLIQKAESAPGRMVLGTSLYTRVRSKSQWTSPVVRHAIIPPDWHAGADIYRAWAARTYKPCDYPDHVKWLLDAWDTQESSRLSCQGWDVIRTSYDQMTGNGTYFMAANRQMISGVYGHCTATSAPCPAWGSEREFAQQLHALQARGGMYSPYINFERYVSGTINSPRLFWYPKSRLPKDIPVQDLAWWEQAAARGYNGVVARPGNDPTTEDGPMAHGSAAWRDYIDDWTHRYAGWGADAMYYDECCRMGTAGWLYPGYEDSYGHTLRARTDLLRRVRDEMHKTNPYFTLDGEVIQDQMCQALDMPMNSRVTSAIDVFRYCVPWAIMINGAWDSGYAMLGGYEHMRFIWQIGARFDQMASWQASQTSMQVTNQFHWDDYDRKILRLRRAVKSILYDAAYRDTVGIVIRDEQGRELGPEAADPLLRDLRGVTGRWFRYDKDGQKGAVINIINMVSGDKSDTSDADYEKLVADHYRLPKTLPPPAPRRGAKLAISTKEIGPVQGAVAWTLEGECFPVLGKQEGDTYTFDVPVSEMSSVVLSTGGLAPVVTWEMDNIAAPGVHRPLKLTLTNVNAKPASGTAELLLPEGWPKADLVAFGPIASGGRTDLSVPVEIPLEAKKGRYDVRCRVKSESGAFITYNFVVVNDPVLVEFRGNPGNYHLWFKNLTEQPLTGSIKVNAATPLSASSQESVEIPAQNEVTVPVSVKGRDKLSEIAEIEADVRIGGQSHSLVRGILPVVSNGGFEMDFAGDGFPDWWLCHETPVPGGKTRNDFRLALDRMSLDSAAPHSGKYCLRISGVEPGVRAYTASSMNSVLDPRTRYRVSVWLRSKAEKGVSMALVGYTRLGEGKTRDEWQQFTKEFATGDGDAISGIGLQIQILNTSPEPAFVDDLVIEELGPALP